MENIQFVFGFRE